MFAVLVIGPAGVGKTTLCHALQEYGQIQKRGVYVVNLDPAADALPYRPDVDIRELITVSDAMKEMDFGPNGGLVYCMEYLALHLSWLESKLRAFGPDDTLLFDCPGQLELYTHVPVMPKIARAMTERWNVRTCCAYLVDAVAIHDAHKFVAGLLAGLSAMLVLPVPRLTVLSKTDLLPSNDALEAFLDIGSAALFLDRCDARDARLVAMRREREEPGDRDAGEDAEISEDKDEFSATQTPSTPMNARLRRLTDAVARLVDDHAMISFVPFTVKDDDAAAHVMAFADHLTQYYEDAEVRIPEDDRSAAWGDDDFAGFGGRPSGDDDDDDGGRGGFGTQSRPPRDLYAAASAMYGPGAVGDYHG